MTECKKVPRFLQVNSGEESVARRPKLSVDELSGEGTALDVIRKRPMLRTKIIKKVKRQLAELEELRAFAEQKGSKNMTREELENIFKD